MKSEEEGLVPEPAEDLGHLPVSQGVGREGITGHHCITPTNVQPFLCGLFLA